MFTITFLGSNAHPVVIEDITVVYSRYRGVHFSSETVMMLLRQLSHAIKTRSKEKNTHSYDDEGEIFLLFLLWWKYF